MEEQLLRSAVEYTATVPSINPPISSRDGISLFDFAIGSSSRDTLALALAFAPSVPLVDSLVVLVYLFMSGIK